MTHVSRTGLADVIDVSLDSCSDVLENNPFPEKANLYVQ